MVAGGTSGTYHCFREFSGFTATPRMMTKITAAKASYIWAIHCVEEVIKNQIHLFSERNCPMSIFYLLHDLFPRTSGKDCIARCNS